MEFDLFRRGGVVTELTKTGLAKTDVVVYRARESQNRKLTRGHRVGA